MINWGLLDHIDPAALAYQDWLAVGMAIKHEGGALALWDQWSQRDATRYRAEVCHRKWDGFNGSTSPVTWGTVVELAKQQGWQPPARRDHHAFEWEDEISFDGDDLRIIDPAWIEDAEVAVPGDEWNPVVQLDTYLSTLFESSEYVGYVTESWLAEDGRHLPKRGSYTRTAGELRQALSTCNGDIGAVMGDYDPATGAWIRFNPLDGKGVRDDNVTAFRFALIESDTISIERQKAIYTELELPIAALVHSGKKSLHAIVRVGAASKEEYRERVNYLHKVCLKNGLEIDGANKNPSRLSRMPGVTRAGEKQYLVGVNLGKASWEEWKAYIEEANDSLPDIECLADQFDNLPELAPPLIDGLLREGHKMLLAGPSKAGKSFLLLQMALAIADGREWLGWPCAQGKVLYVNLELDRASCLHRLKSLYSAYGLAPAGIGNIDIWNLRGKAESMDKLAPKLIRRAEKKQYKAVIIDPIYKVITGDENAADKMAHFCNQFDKVCLALKSAVIYCHHHSKGSQGQKNARDRSSGSGVFARDPDAILDLIELIIPDKLARVIENREVCAAIEKYLDQFDPGWRIVIGQDTAIVADQFLPAAVALGAPAGHLEAAVADARARAVNMSGWRMEADLREFAPMKPRAVFFQYPIHKFDVDGLLVDAKADGEEAPWIARKKDENKGDKPSPVESVLSAFTSLSTFSDDPVMVGDLADHMGMTVKTLTGLLKKTTQIALGSDYVIRQKDAHEQFLFEDVFNKVADLEGNVKLADLAEKMKRQQNGVRKLAMKIGYEIKAGFVVKKEEAL